MKKHNRTQESCSKRNCHARYQVRRPLNSWPAGSFGVSVNYFLWILPVSTGSLPEVAKHRVTYYLWKNTHCRLRWSWYRPWSIAPTWNIHLMTDEEDQLWIQASILLTSCLSRIGQLSELFQAFLLNCKRGIIISLTSSGECEPGR